ncbi:hypothetical protein AVEN_17491-1 [Araneus ventricosus]|uniref:DUF19 domain-containing protein n=1 Tax=Araneus ventricosus TaxID=182803 RepID=A0A4Y2JG70_ARAVE|nr:hypothetical protein AVEN_17491-1 [Araneus ventricosus]
MMKIQSISLILAVFLAGYLVLSNLSDRNDAFCAEFHCISSSGNQEMCNAYLDCLFALSEEYLQPYHLCMDEVVLKGIGNCSEHEEMYESEDKRNKLNACYRNLTMQPDGSDWTKIPGLDGYKDCVSIIGTDCLVKRCAANKS